MGLDCISFQACCLLARDLEFAVRGKSCRRPEGTRFAVSPEDDLKVQGLQFRSSSCLCRLFSHAFPLTLNF
jgi:hypothetical protein